MSWLLAAVLEEHLAHLFNDLPVQLDCKLPIGKWYRKVFKQNLEGRSKDEGEAIEIRVMTNTEQVNDYCLPCSHLRSF